MRWRKSQTITRIFHLLFILHNYITARQGILGRFPMRSWLHGKDLEISAYLLIWNLKKGRGVEGFFVLGYIHHYQEPITWSLQLPCIFVTVAQGFCVTRDGARWRVIELKLSAWRETRHHNLMRDFLFLFLFLFLVRVAWFTRLAN